MKMMKLLVLLFCMVVVVHFDCVESCNTQLVTEGTTDQGGFGYSGQLNSGITQCKLISEGYPVKYSSVGVCSTALSCNLQGRNNDNTCNNYCIFTINACYGLCSPEDECSGSPAGQYKCVCFKADESNGIPSTQPPSGK
uniref:Cnidarian restricted protein n=1 Tax=Clytia hemisphaerica TaxID=252671 RepID=A0A7M5UQ04_9CNID|eukprot:TCONS_00064335-protein